MARVDAAAAMPDASASEAAWRVLVAAAGTAEAETAVRVEQEVLGEVFGDTPEELAAVYGPSAPRSVFPLVVDAASGEPLGMMRLVAAPRGVDDLPSVAGVARDRGVDAEAMAADAGVDPRETIDVAVVAVRRRWRGEASASVALFQALGMVTRTAGARWLVALIDEAVFGHVQRLTAEIFTPWPGAAPGPFLGSPSSVLAVTDLAAWRRRSREHAPEVLRCYWQGRGGPPRWQPASWQEIAAAVEQAAGVAFRGGVHGPVPRVLSSGLRTSSADDDALTSTKCDTGQAADVTSVREAQRREGDGAAAQP